MGKEDKKLYLITYQADAYFNGRLQLNLKLDRGSDILNNSI